MQHQGVIALPERLEPMINSGIVAFCDSSKLVSQLYDIGWQNGKIGPRRSDMRDDHANAAAVEQGKGSMPLTDTPQGCRPPLDISDQSDKQRFCHRARGGVVPRGLAAHG